MRIRDLGSIGQQGGVDAGACPIIPEYLALTSFVGNRHTVHGLRLDIPQHRVDLVWQHDISGGEYHLWSGHRLSMNSTSVLSIGTGLLCVAGGLRRLLVKAQDGTIAAETEAIAAPTAAGAVVGAVLLVPEGQSLAAYDVVTMALQWRRPTPQGTWIFAPPAGLLVPVEDESEEFRAIWHWEDDTLWRLPDFGSHIRAVSMFADGTVIVPVGGGAPSGLIALDPHFGTIRWRAIFPRPDPVRPPAEGPFPFPFPVAINGNRLYVATATPAAACLAITDGAEVWQTALDAQPTALALSKGTILVGNERGQVIALDAETGIYRDRMQLTDEEGWPGFPVSIVPTSPSWLNADIAYIAVTRSGTVHEVLF